MTHALIAFVSDHWRRILIVMFVLSLAITRQIANDPRNAAPTPPPGAVEIDGTGICPTTSTTSELTVTLSDGTEVICQYRQP